MSFINHHDLCYKNYYKLIGNYVDYKGTIQSNTYLGEFVGTKLSSISEYGSCYVFIDADKRYKLEELYMCTDNVKFQKVFLATKSVREYAEP
jgi:hypothetical protein